MVTRLLADAARAVVVLAALVLALALSQLVLRLAWRGLWVEACEGPFTAQTLTD